MTIYKHKCSCGESWFSDSEVEIDCDFADPDDDDEQANHIVSRVKTLTAEDFAEMRESALESANRHSLTDMPTDILNVLKKNIKDNKIIRNVIKSLYEAEIGLD